MAWGVTYLHDSCLPANPTPPGWVIGCIASTVYLSAAPPRPAPFICTYPSIATRAGRHSYPQH